MLNRRDFLKAAGAAAGASALYTFLPGLVYAGEGAGGGAVCATSAVRRPSFAAPALVLPGQPMACMPTGNADIAEAWLQPAGAEQKIALEYTPESGNGDTGPHGGVLSLKGNPAPGLYDLYVVAERGGKQRLERQPHAVAVYEAFPTDFVFGVISDVHFGDFRIQNVMPDFSIPDTFRAEIEILNGRGVAFCLCCGDLCNIPPKTKSELMDYMDALENHARFPVLSVPGNHDGYAAGAGGAKITSDTFEYWEKMFGPMESETTFGDMSLIGINTFEKEASERNLYGGLGEAMDQGAMGAEQLQWLDSALARASARPGATVLFGHHNPTNTVVDVNGPFSITPFAEKGRKELLGLLEKHKPETLFCGHVHGVFEETYASTRVITVPTAASVPYDKSHPIGIDIVTVKSGRIAEVETIEMARVPA